MIKWVFTWSRILNQYLWRNLEFLILNKNIVWRNALVKKEMKIPITFMETMIYRHILKICLKLIHLRRKRTFVYALPKNVQLQSKMYAYVLVKKLIHVQVKSLIFLKKRHLTRMSQIINICMLIGMYLKGIRSCLIVWLEQMESWIGYYVTELVIYWRESSKRK